MVRFVEVAEIRGTLADETRHYEARTVNGNSMPARDWRKRYVSAEIRDGSCVLRFNDDVKQELPAFRKGMQCEVIFNKVEIDADMSQVHVLEIKELKKS